MLSRTSTASILAGQGVCIEFVRLHAVQHLYSQSTCINVATDQRIRWCIMYNRSMVAHRCLMQALPPSGWLHVLLQMLETPLLAVAVVLSDLGSGSAGAREDSTGAQRSMTQVTICYILVIYTWQACRLRGIAIDSTADII